MDKSLQIRNSTIEFLMFTAQNGEESIEVRYEDETVWLTQKMMASLLDVSVPTVNEHLKNIFSQVELVEDSVIRKFLTTASDRKLYKVKCYNLNAIISVGYRVNSVRATQFRQWATSVLREYPVKADRTSISFIARIVCENRYRMTLANSVIKRNICQQRPRQLLATG